MKKGDFDENVRKKLIFSEGSNFFRQRLILSLLSSRPIKIQNIRSNCNDVEVGLRPYEVSFIHLLSRISLDSKFTISETGTEVSLIPGIINGDTLTYETNIMKSISYYLEPILLLAPFSKKPIQLTLKGKLQNDSSGNYSIYKLKEIVLPLMQLFGIESQIQIINKGYNKGEILFSCNVKKQLLTLRNQLNESCGKVKRIRGVAYGYRVSPQILSRIVNSAKGVFLPYLSDIYIVTDQIKDKQSKIPGYGLMLYSTTTKNIIYSSDAFIGKDIPQNESKKSKKRKYKLFEEGDDDDDDDNDDNDVERVNSVNDEILINSMDMSTSLNVNGPEELGHYVGNELIKEIRRESSIDSVCQWLVLGYMGLGPKNVSSIQLSTLTPYTIQFLRDFKEFFGLTFRIQQLNEQLFKLTCLGTGYINLNKTLI